MDIKSYIRDIPNFPKQGILFKDITPLLKNPVIFYEATEALFDQVRHLEVDIVVGMESRGFLFGTILARKLKAGFVPVRKPGKLPADKLSQIYALEYGTDTLEIHQDAIQNGEKVLIHDDVLATGGTAKAACELVERLGGEIVQCNFLIELVLLKGKEKLNGYDTKSLLQY